MSDPARRDLHVRDWSTTRLADVLRWQPAEWAGTRDWNDIEVAAHAADAVAMLTELRGRIDATLATVDDDVLRARQPGDVRPAWANVTYSWLEAAHHCAEVGVLRDLYRSRFPG